MDKTFIQSMEVGYYFQKELYDNDNTIDWNGSEQCSTFAKIIVDYAEENNCDIDIAFYEIKDKAINEINNNKMLCIDNMCTYNIWNNYCKGFLAGEIIGLPTEENLIKVEKAEKLWENEEKYGYYQEVLEEVK